MGLPQRLSELWRLGVREWFRDAWFWGYLQTLTGLPAVPDALGLIAVSSILNLGRR